jgi:hypothetical protein
MECTKLVQPSALNYCTPLHTYNKDNTKDNKKLTTVPPDPSSSSFFSEKQKAELLTFKHKTDSRIDELFLDHCIKHVESQVNDLSKYQRFTGLKHILTKLYETGEHFRAKGFAKEIKKEAQRTTPPTKEDIEKYKNCTPGYEWVNEWRNKQA